MTHGYYQIMRLAKSAHNLKLRVNRQWNRGADKQGKVSCRKCKFDHCCYQFVAGSLFEGVMIANNLIHSGDKDRLKALVDQGMEQQTLVKASGWEPEHGMTKAWERMTFDWFNRKEPCALLQDGRCTLYGLRPTNCSTYCVYTSSDQCGGEAGVDILGGDNTEPIQNNLLLDAEFYRAVMDLKDTSVIVPPTPLGIAVFSGITLLTSGPRALEHYSRVKEVCRGPEAATMEDADEQETINEGG